MRKKRLLYSSLCLLVLLLFSGGCGGGGGHHAREPFVDPAFLSDLEFDETLFFEDEGADILVYVMAAPTEGVDSIALYRTDEDGEALSLVSYLLDNGSASAGDVLPRDGVYSFLIPPSAQPDKAGSYYYRAFLDAETTRGSSLVELEVVEDIEIGAYEKAISETEDMLAHVIPGYDGKIEENQFHLYRDQILAELLADSDVLRADLSDEGTAILVEFTSGVDLCVTYERTRIGTSSIREAIARELQYPASVEALLSTDGFPAATKRVSQPIGSYTTRSLSPFYSQFISWGGDDSNYAYRLLQNSAEPLFAAEPPVRGEEVTTEHFKNIARFGVVILSSHGVVLNGEPTVVLSRQHSSAEIDALRKEIDSGALILGNGGTLHIGPKFIARHNDARGRDGYINLGLCQGIMREGLADALLEAGFAGVTGFTDNVDNDYAYNCSGTMIESMLSGQPFKVAYATTVAKLGEQDPRGNARFVMRMRSDVDDFYITSRDAHGSFVSSVGIRNGDFARHFDYWEVDGGYTSTVSTLSGLSPVSGQLMAIIGTGFGGGGFDTEARLVQRFTVPQRAMKLSFNYDFISEHPHTAQDPQSRLDEFRASLIGPDGVETALVQEFANTLQWIPLSSDIFGNPAEQAYHTGWRRIECDIPEQLLGSQVELVFLVEEDAGCNYDSGILLDDVVLNAK